MAGKVYPGARFLVDRFDQDRNRGPLPNLYIPIQNLFPPFFGLSSSGASRASDLGGSTGSGGVRDVIGIAGQDGDILGCADRRGGGDIGWGDGGGALCGVATAAKGAMSRKGIHSTSTEFTLLRLNSLYFD